MLKRISLIMLCIGLTLTLTSIIATLVCMQNPSQEMLTTLIDAEDLTFFHVFSVAHDGIFLLMLVTGIGLFIPSAFCLVFKNTAKKHCTVLTTLTSLALSGCGAAGIMCAFELMVFGAFGEQSAHPVAYRVSLVGGTTAFCLFVLFCMLYVYLRVKRRSVPGVVIDVVTSIVYLPIAIVVLVYLVGVIF